MAGYAIQARVGSVRPRLGSHGSDPFGRDRAPGSSAAECDADAVVRIVEAGDESVPSLAERWRQAGRIWSETTFFLFDPDSWR